MIFAYLAWLSPLIFIPGIYDAFSGPKKSYVLFLGIAATIYLAVKKEVPPLLYPIALYLLIATIPLFWVSDPYLFVERLGIDFAGIALFWVLASERLDKEDIEKVCLFALGVVVLCYVIRHLAYSVDGLFYPMGNPKYFALMAAQVLPLLLALQNGFVVGLGLIVLSIFSAESRAALLASFGAGLYILLLLLWKREIARVASVLILLIPLVVLFVPFPFDSRQSTWTNSKVMAKDAMIKIVGFGRGQFQVEYPVYANRVVRDTSVVMEVRHPRDRFMPGHPHNEALNQIIETGIGYLVLLFILVRIFFSIKVNGRIQVALAGSLVSTILLSAFWFPLSHPSMAITFWSTAGLLWSVSNAKTY